MDEFNFYNSENDGYRGGFGSYEDPVPTPPGTPFSSGGAQPPKKKRGGAAKVIALVLACTIAGGGAGVGGAYLYNRIAGPQNSTTIYEEDRPQVRTVVNTNNGQPMTPEQLYAANLASCVGITVNTTQNIWGQTTTSAASGSGFVLSQDGYIATNYHVIESAVNDASVTIQVSFANGDKYDAKLVGGEKDNDVAVLKIEATGLTPVTLGDSSKLVVGESVYAIGNPLGELTFSMTGGMVSCMDRAINVDGTPFNMIQTDASINPGNSGGPLFNAYGEVVGIVSAKYSDASNGTTAEGLGFAIPMNDVFAMIKDIMTNGYVTNKPYLGITPGTMSAQMAAQYRYDVEEGVFIYSVEEGTAAADAGLQMGDVITKVDDVKVSTVDELTATKKKYSAGDDSTLEVYRNGQTITVNITWGATPVENQAAALQQQQQQQQQNQNNQQTPFYGYGDYGNGYNPFEEFFRNFYGGYYG